MKKFYLKGLCALLCLLASVNAYADEVIRDGIIYQTDEMVYDEILGEEVPCCAVIGLDEDLEEVIIPSSITDDNGEEWPVKMIFGGSFGYRNGIKKIVLGENVTYAENLAECCYDLEEVQLNEGLQYMSGYSFSQTKLTSITLPSTLMYLDAEVFGDMPYLTEVVAKMENPIEVDIDYLFNLTDRSNISLVVPEESAQTYLNNGWTGFAAMKSLESGEELSFVTHTISKSGNIGITVNGSSFSGGEYTILSTKATEFTFNAPAGFSYSLFVDNVDVTAGIVNNSYTLPASNVNHRVNVKLQAATVYNNSGYTMYVNGQRVYNNNSLSVPAKDVEVYLDIDESIGYSLFVDNVEITKAEETFTFVAETDANYNITAEIAKATIYNSSEYDIYVNGNVLNAFDAVEVSSSSSIVISIEPEDVNNFSYNLFVNEIDVTENIIDNQYTFVPETDADYEIIIALKKSCIVNLTDYEMFANDEVVPSGDMIEISNAEPITISMNPEELPVGYTFSYIINGTNVGNLMDGDNYTFTTSEEELDIEIVLNTASYKVTSPITLQINGNYIANGNLSFSRLEDVTIALDLSTVSEGYTYQLLLDGNDVTSDITDNSYTISGSQERNSVSRNIEFKLVREGIVFADRYMTFSDNVNREFADDDPVKAWIVSGYKGGKAILSRVNIVPANTGVLLEAEAGTNFNLKMTSETAYYSNLLKPTTSGRIDSEETDYLSGRTFYNYILGKNDENVIGFYRAEEGGIATDKAYLSLPADFIDSQSEAKGFRLQFGEDEATGIESVEQESTDDDAYYTLSGQKVLKPVKGVYIHKGMKIYVK